ncbi:MAG: FKBP-type peptidyl-prolyl cis-trans isomerase [Bacteroidales bacterium]|nr:FKBP-type peptidyl-prolyl cis-trans isomerase [Bacteroidales bacterium]
MTKRITLIAVMSIAVASICFATACKKDKKEANEETITVVVKSDKPVELKSEEDSISWALGIDLAQRLASSGITPNRELLFQAMCYTLDKQKQPLTQTQMSYLRNKIETKQFKYLIEHQGMMEQEAAKRETEYFAMIQEKNPKIKKSESGIYYEVLKEGNGRQAERGLVVKFDYKGSFTNGQIFDQTYGNRVPITTVLNESTMIPGMVDGICLMKGGSTYRLYLPYGKAWGDKGTEHVPPYATVIFDVELHDVQD